jgi:hypothetical protein
MRAHSAILFNAVSATGAGSPVSWPGGLGSMAGSGTFGGTTLTLEFRNVDGNWVSVPTTSGSAVSMTAQGMTTFYAPCGNLRGVLTSGTPSGLSATVGTASDG